MEAPLLKAENVIVEYKGTSSSKTLRAVNQVNLALFPGETLGIVGESGCGKSTLARTLIGLQAPQAGSVSWKNHNVYDLDKNMRLLMKRSVQMIFQDPLASLNPLMTIRDILMEPLQVHFPTLSEAEKHQRILNFIQKVGLLPDHLSRYPHAFSGGQCQRIGIARAMIVEPQVIICDEPVSALDVSIQAQILHLLADLQKEYGLSLIFISHNLSVVRLMSHRVLVLFKGHVMEEGTRSEVFHHQRHPYTRELIAAIPHPDMEYRPQLTLLKQGTCLSIPSGCVYASRCAYRQKECLTHQPPLKTIGNTHHVSACFFANTLPKVESDY